MALVTLACPFCDLSKELEESLLPPAGTMVNCPKCKGRFPLLFASQAAPENASPLVPESFYGATAGAAASACAPHQVEASVFPQIEPTFAEPPPPPPRAPSTSSNDSSKDRSGTLNFTFTGNAREYFGIWIVNTLLRIVTLGIYSPWAKVRKRRYFCCNTLLDDAPFDYLADPLAILKGWFIAGLFFGIYSLVSNISPILSNLMALLFAAIYPWVLVRARIFTLRNSSHRNIRFSFNPNYRDAYKVYLWLPMLVPFTLGILAPYVLYRQKRFVVENSSYGTTPFEFEATPKQYVRIFLPLIVLVPLSIAAVGGVAFLVKGGQKPGLMAIIPAVGFLCIYLAAALYIPTAITNLTWNSTRIAGHSFDSTLGVLDLAWIYVSNAVAVVCTLGLLTPWASVRLARYRLRKLTLNGAGALDAIVAAGGDSPGATAEEFGDIVGLDLGL